MYISSFEVIVSKPTQFLRSLFFYVSIVGTANSNSKTGFTKLESIKGSENLPAFNIGYYQDQHFQSLISTEKKNESVEKTKKRSANTNIEKISKKVKSYMSVINAPTLHQINLTLRNI